MINRLYRLSGLSLNTSLFLNSVKLTAFFVVMVACNDEPGRLGLGLIPPDDLPGIEIKENFRIRAFTSDTFRIVTANEPNGILGRYTDELSGMVNADFATGLTYLPFVSESDTMPERTYILNKVTMSIKYTSVAGDSAIIPSFELYRLTSPLPSSHVFSDSDLEGYYDKTNLIDSIRYVDSTQMIYLVLSRLTADFLLEAAFPDGNRTTHQEFDKSFPGVFFKTKETTPNRMISIDAIYIDVNVNVISLGGKQVFYGFVMNNHNLTNRPPETVIFPDHRVTRFSHTHTAPNLNDTSAKDQEIHIRSMGGANGVIEILDLEEMRYRVGKVIVNRAELFVPSLIDTSQRRFFSVPSQLGIRLVGGGYQIIPDDYRPDSREATLIMDGLFNPIKGGYTFYLTQYFQDYFSNKTHSTAFRLFPGKVTEASLSSLPLVSTYQYDLLPGAGNTERKIVFRLALTNL